MHFDRTVIRSGLSAAAMLVTAACMVTGPHCALADPITIAENDDENLKNTTPLGLDSVALGGYTAVGETGKNADTFTVELVNGQKTITDFKSDPNNDSSPADSVNVFKNDDTLKITPVFLLKSPKEGLGVPEAEVPEPHLTFLSVLALLAAIGVWGGAFGLEGAGSLRR